MPNNTSGNKKSSDQSLERTHYEKLTEYFKTLVGYTFTAFSIIVGVAIYCTYSNMKDMRDELREGKNELQAQLEKMKDESKNTQEDISNKASGLMSNLKNTQDLALGEISNFKGIAITQAQNKVEEVFEKRNLDTFVEQVAKRRLEPKITSYVDSKMLLEQRNRVNRAIDGLLSNDAITFSRSYTYLTLSIIDYELDDKQIDNIIKAYDSSKIDQGYKNGMPMIFSYRRSDKIANFFKEKLMDGKESNVFNDIAIRYFLQINPSSSLDIYENFLKKEGDKRSAFSRLITESMANNSTLSLRILNSKQIVDILFTNIELDAFKTLQQDLRNSTKEYISSTDFTRSYFNNKN